MLEPLRPGNSPSTVEINCSNDSELNSGQEIAAKELAIAVACNIYGLYVSRNVRSSQELNIFNGNICILDYIIG